MKKTTFLSFGSATLALTLICGAGCHSSSTEQRDLMFDDLTAGERPVSMKGEAVFLDGKLAATATVSRGFDHGSKDAPHAGKGKGKGKDMRSSSDTMADYSSSASGDSEEAQQEAMEDYMRLIRAQRAAGSPMPPVTLRVQFQNHSPEPVVVEVTDVNSDLGNFAVRPDKLTVAAGETGKLEPMISQLGVTSDEIPIKVTVRVAGKKETHTLVVKSVLAPIPVPKK